MICAVWVGEYQCGQKATHITTRTRVLVCVWHAERWGRIYETED